MALPINYTRRATDEVTIGRVKIGGRNPIAVQSMTNTPTMDTEASVAQCAELAKAGADIVRLTAQTPAHAHNLANIHRELRALGIDTPLVADIHFNPEAAFAAAEVVEKVRINPGNFVDPGRTFVKLEYTDEEYAAELKRIEDKLVPLLDLCRSRGVALRLGVNHGSLSDRIMSRYGDTPAGMVESAMEFLRVCRLHDFNNVVISIKASNVVVMTGTVRLLVKAMDAENMHYPLHLGVTEAGDGEDARIKSAVGIGSLLADGIGDTIRVSLSEDPVNEIPVARQLLRHVVQRAAGNVTDESAAADVVPSRVLAQPLVAGLDKLPEKYNVAAGQGGNAVGMMRTAARRAVAEHPEVPLMLKVAYPTEMTYDDVVIAASVDLGSLLLEGFGDIIDIQAPSLTDEQRRDLALGILQATRLRMTKTEYIACPSCGRTLFDLQRTLAEVKKATAGQRSLKIGVMGCIVNGPGEMADADYGYVGAGPGRVSIYRGKQCVTKNIPAEEALGALINLIKADGRWIDED